MSSTYAETLTGASPGSSGKDSPVSLPLSLHNKGSMAKL
uniref:Uncharacterized protein n=1 Tax=Anguilla anguilla TaxID=7936 RepID=A0A0E9RXF9_ANGAN